MAGKNKNVEGLFQLGCHLFHPTPFRRGRQWGKGLLVEGDEQGGDTICIYPYNTTTSYDTIEKSNGQQIRTR